MSLRIFLTGALFALAGCASPPPLVPGPYLKVAPQGELPPPLAESVAQPQRAYLIGPYDKLAVTVFGVPELSQNVQADGGGKIALPLVGTVDAAGKTPATLADTIAAGLRNRYVKNPQVTVNLLETVSQVINVDGQVVEPGLYPVVGRMTLMGAIATAKGASEFAKLEDVVIFRKVGDQQMAGLYNLAAIRQGTYKDPEVYANDIVIVGDSPARRRFKNLLQAAPLLSTPIIALLQ